MNYDNREQVIPIYAHHPVVYYHDICYIHRIPDRFWTDYFFAVNLQTNICLSISDCIKNIESAFNTGAKRYI